MVWKLGRHANTGDQVVPRFNGWLSMVSNCDVSKTNKTLITYLPPIHKPITEYSTIFEYLTQTQRFAKQAHMPYVHLTLDVGTATKAFHVVWNYPEEFKDIIIHLGDFHLLQEHFGIIGQLVTGSGFEDIIFQADICASGSLQGVLRGKHYNRAWNVHKHFADALERLVLTAFIESTGESLCVPPVLVDLIHSVPQAIDFSTLVHDPDVASFQTRYEDFRDSIPDGNLGKAPQLWMTYLDVMDNQTLPHAAIKENNFDLRLFCWKNSIPLFFSFNEQNYARYGTYYVHTLETLEAVKPEAKQLLETQGISVQRSHHKSSRQAVDQAGEQTYNRSAKIPGGIKQFAAHQSSYEKWVLNRPHLAKFINALLEITRLDSSIETPQKTCKPSQIMKSEQRVQAVLRVLEHEFINPFSTGLDKERLYNLCSGAPINTSIEQSLISMVQRGTNRYHEFVANRLDDNQIKIFALISRSPLKTFANANKKVKVVAKGKVKELAIERNILGKLVTLSSKHKSAVGLNKALTHCLGPIPLSIANADGTRRTTTKSMLLEVFNDYCPVLSTPELPKKKAVAAYIVDLKAAVHVFKEIPETFGDLAMEIWRSLPCGYKRLDVVADTYVNKSIKEAKRLQRGGSDKYIIKGPKTKIPRNFSQFLSNGSNKECMIDLIMQVWEENQDTLSNGQLVYFSKRDKCYIITNEITMVADGLSSNQEADTKIALHVQHAMKIRPGPVIIRSPSGDTDIPVILLAVFPECDHSIYLDNGHGNSRKIYNITACDISIPLKKALVGLHAFTGNDYVSAFFRKGKKSCWNMLQKHPKYVDAFLELGIDWQLCEGVADLLEQFVYKLYGKTQTNSVDIARQQIFWDKHNINY